MGGALQQQQPTPNTRLAWGWIIEDGMPSLTLEDPHPAPALGAALLAHLEERFRLDWEPLPIALALTPPRSGGHARDRAELLPGRPGDGRPDHCRVGGADGLPAAPRVPGGRARGGGDPHPSRAASPAGARGEGVRLRSCAVLGLFRRGPRFPYYRQGQTKREVRRSHWPPAHSSLRYETGLPQESPSLSRKATGSKQ